MPVASCEGVAEITRAQTCSAWARVAVPASAARSERAVMLRMVFCVRMSDLLRMGRKPR